MAAFVAASIVYQDNAKKAQLGMVLLLPVANKPT